MIGTTLIFQSPFSGDFLCFKSLSVKGWTIENGFQSPFSGDFLCFLRNLNDRTAIENIKLSISIFRRLSLFPLSPIITLRRNNISFNLHFQETFFVSSRLNVQTNRLYSFQSPFSGDFLCFMRRSIVNVNLSFAFNLHFQETFFVSYWTISLKSKRQTFNLHFQETFFVSSPSCLPSMTYLITLSISIFRRLSLFLQKQLSYLGIKPNFQSPFSGDFLCFFTHCCSTI